MHLAVSVHDEFEPDDGTDGRGQRNKVGNNRREGQAARESLSPHHAG